MGTQIKPGKRRSILCVEDNSFIREMLHSALKMQYPDIMISVAENGEQGLVMFKEHRPEVIVTDIDMPVMNGIRMASEIRSLDTKTAIIVVSGLFDETYREEASEIGISHCLSKPFELVKLYEILDRYVYL